MSFHGASFKQGRDVLAWDPISGWLIRRPWSGTPHEMASLRTTLKLQGVKFEDAPGIEGGYETVWGIFGAEESQSPTEELSNGWDLVGNDLEKDIWTHPKVTALFAPHLDQQGFPTDSYAALRRDIDDIVSGAKLPSEVGKKSPSDEGWWKDAFPDTKKFVRLLLRGGSAYSVSQFVLRNTKIVAANYTEKAEIDRVGKMMTTDQVKTFYAIPETIKFRMPEGFWLERTPTVQQTTATKFTITREWWHVDSYEDFIYSTI